MVSVEQPWICTCFPGWLCAGSVDLYTFSQLAIICAGPVICARFLGLLYAGPVICTPCMFLDCVSVEVNIFVDVFITVFFFLARQMICTRLRLCFCRGQAILRTFRKLQLCRRQNRYSCALFHRTVSVHVKMVVVQTRLLSILFFRTLSGTESYLSWKHLKLF